MLRLEIPERAEHQATEALLDYLDPTDVAATAANAVLEAAGPIIMANRLRQLADDYARRADQIDVPLRLGRDESLPGDEIGTANGNVHSNGHPEPNAGPTTPSGISSTHTPAVMPSKWGG